MEVPSRYQFQPDAIKFLTQPMRKPGWKLCTVSPTGTGKTFMGTSLQRKLGRENTIILLPTPELMPDWITKQGRKVPETKSKMVATANSLNIYSTLDLRNKLMRGKELDHITDIIPDEAHHDFADTYKLIYVSMRDTVRRWGFTATPYCGNPQATHKWRKQWDEIYYATKLSDCLESGAITYPNIVVVPLVNDDILTIQNGEFVLSQVESEYENKIEHALAITKERGWWDEDGKPTKATIIGAPSSKCFEWIDKYACKLGLQMNYIDQSTTFSQRQRIFQRLRTKQSALVHINVVSEGKDLPVRNYLDLRPCMSPRLFFQIFGRGTRPLGEGEGIDGLGEYLCTNRNIERHCYLFENTLPYEQVRKAILAFPEESKRTGVRAFGIESLGRIKPTFVKLVNGLTVTVYNVSQVENGKKEVFVCMLHPTLPEPLWFRQTAGTVRDGNVQRMAYQRFEHIVPPTELKGYRSCQPYPLTEGQLKTWKKHSKDAGLDPEQKIDAKKFALLPVLIHTGISFL